MSCANEALMKLRLAIRDQEKASLEVGTKSMQLGAAIRDARKRQGISRAKFCKLIGYTATMVSYLESGDRLWSVENAEKAIRVINRNGLWPARGARK
jgi:DNA-binding transcriptional regulator YiaG